MILTISYEELQALHSGAHNLLEERNAAVGTLPVPRETLVQVALLEEELGSYMSIETLEEQRRIRAAVQAVCDRSHAQMEEAVLERHPADEEAVSQYFNYAHCIGVLQRLDEIGAQLEAMRSLMRGDDSDLASPAESHYGD